MDNSSPVKSETSIKSENASGDLIDLSASPVRQQSTPIKKEESREVKMEDVEEKKSVDSQIDLKNGQEHPLHDHDVREAFQRLTGWSCRLYGKYVFVDVPGNSTIVMHGHATVDVLVSGSIRLKHGKGEATPKSARKCHLVIGPSGTVRYELLY